MTSGFPRPSGQRRRPPLSGSRPLARLIPGRAAGLALAALSGAAAALGTGAAPAQADLFHHLTLVDNSNADSWLEVDRTANFEHGNGTAGSDHDGSAVDLMDTLVNRDRPDPDDDPDRAGSQAGRAHPAARGTGTP